MESTAAEMITISTQINAPITKIWESWNAPVHIMNWYHASPDWHAPAAENDLRVGGKFKTTMAAKDGSFSFDFSGIYTAVEEHKSIDYTLDDGRRVSIQFENQGSTVLITEQFEPESENPLEMQQAGWQAILDNFKSYTEQN